MKIDDLKYVTVLYEVVNKEKFKGVNPMDYEHNGLKTVGVSAGDMFAEVERLEEGKDK